MIYGLLLFPFACELLLFRKLSGSHAGSHVVTRFYCFVTARFSGVSCGRKVEPFLSLYVVLGDSLSIVVHDAEVVLRFGISLSGGEAFLSLLLLLVSFLTLAAPKWHCQLIRTEAVVKASEMIYHWVFSLGSQGGSRDLSPALESFLHLLPIDGRGKPMAARTEMLGDKAIC
jgi:hypothetical protein